MTLLSPAALWTLAALALPLAIHLWRRPPRTVLLGSLRFLQTRPRRLQSLRWREHALLAARLGLLTALALLLARPFWNEPTPVRPARWALLDPAAAPAGPSLDRLRALQAAGGETRALAPGFPKVNAWRPDPAAPAPRPLVAPARGGRHAARRIDVDGLFAGPAPLPSGDTPVARPRQGRVDRNPDGTCSRPCARRPARARSRSRFGSVRQRPRRRSALRSRGPCGR